MLTDDVFWLYPVKPTRVIHGLKGNRKLFVMLFRTVTNGHTFFLTFLGNQYGLYDAILIGHYI